MGNVCAHHQPSEFESRLRLVPTLGELRAKQFRDVLGQLLTQIAFDLDEQTSFPVSGKRDLRTVYEPVVLEEVKMQFKIEMFKKGYNAGVEFNTVDRATVGTFRIEAVA